MSTIERKETINKFPEMVVIGPNGLIGNSFTESLRGTEIRFKPVSHSEIDISNASSVESLSIPENSVIVNFAAFTNVDKAQSELNDIEGQAWKTNVLGARNLAQLAKDRNLLLIQIGSDAEFAGQDSFPGPYLENQIEPNLQALSWYGQTKAYGLEEVLKSGCKCAYVRISYPFIGEESPSDFAKKTRNYVEKGYPLFSDQYITPTYMPDLFDAIKIISSKKLKGIFHVATTDVTTPYEFAQKMGFSPKEGSLVKFRAENTHLAPRPVFGGLNCEATQQALNLKFHTVHEALSGPGKNRTFVPTL